MKWIIGGSVLLGLVLGVVAGYFSYGSPAAQTMVWTGLTAWVVWHFLFSLWVRSRKPPEARDPVELQNLVTVCLAMLLNFLPRLFWPDAERVHIAASIVGSVAIGIAMVRLIRHRRQSARRQI